MGNILQKIDAVLRIDRLNCTSNQLRARAVYTIAAALIVSQLINLMVMHRTYGHWTTDHWLALIVIVLLSASILALRVCKAFYLYAGFYALILFAGISASSMLDYTGINTSLLPFLVFGSVVCGFISGWRMVIIYGLAAMAFVWCLFSVSITAPKGALFDPTLFTNRNFQRAVQISIVLGLVTVIASFASYAMHSAFFKLEENADMARQASKAKTQFMSDMSHELRTPLNGIIGMSGLLLKTNLDKAQHQYAEIVNRSSQNLFSILDDILDISKLDLDKYHLKEETFNLKYTLKNIIDLYKPSAMMSEIKIGLRFPQQLPSHFSGDKNAIRQIVNNLMSNAIKFTSEGSAYINVTGEVRQVENETPQICRLAITVADTGIGIAPENIDTIFKRFSTIDTRLSRNQDGTGLGLAISKKMATLMGGYLTVLSRPDEGSSFTLNLELPVAKSPVLITPDVEEFHPLPMKGEKPIQPSVAMEAIKPWAG